MKQLTIERRGANLVAVILIIGVIAIAVVAFMQSGFGPDGLHSHISEYMVMLDNQSRDNVAENTTPVGPIVIVDYDHARLDDLFDQLPTTLRAENDPAVQTVVVITRQSTGIPGAATGAVAPVMSADGSYTITAYLFDRQGRSINAHNVTKKSVITGGGAEAELRAKADPEMLKWIEDQIKG